MLHDSDIVIRGAREHNLRNVSLRLPRNKLIVMTGVSGSGKSSLAFDNAAGGRAAAVMCRAFRWYARQFFEQLERPDVDRIDGLQPHQIFARKIARTFQIARELKRMTVLENLLLVPGQQHGERILHAWFRPRAVRRQEAALRQQAEDVLAVVKLDHLRDEYAANLSGGQKKTPRTGTYYDV
ncbi:MAG: ATP-binding cassette domain-containing protein [Akkermansiaceae bacterium]|nr:ATP-binding cassette domain-containing protein [Akkermansiaceae bacterium]